MPSPVQWWFVNANRSGILQPLSRLVGLWLPSGNRHYCDNPYCDNKVDHENRTAPHNHGIADPP